jgi:ATP-dependent protease ClpP protease subunit
MANNLRRPPNKKFWDFVAPTNDAPAELILYGEISSTSWYGDEITPKQFSDDLAALGDITDLTIRINSGGGDVFAAVAIFTRLKNLKARKTVVIDGWAASAATIIAMAGDVIQISPSAAFMIHNPSIALLGYYETEDVTRFQEQLRMAKNSIINAYAHRTGKDQQELSALMDNESWFIGQEAVDAGFCDEVLFGESEERPGAMVVEISRYRNAPVNKANSRESGGLVNNTITNKEGKNKMDIKNTQELLAAFPEMCKEISDNAAKDERKRIQDIESVALDGFAEIVQAAKFEKPAAASDVAMQIIAAQKKQGENYLTNRDKDVQNSGILNTAPSGHEGINDGVNPYDAAIDKVLPAKK